MAIKKDYLVEKRNVLNEIRANNMTLQELRFFSIYLAKINPRDISTRVVRFTLLEFEKILELDFKIKLDYLKSVTNSLLCKVVNIPIDERGGYIAFQLFKKCVVQTDEKGQWYIEIDAHDDALPLMFEFKERYFTYELWNALRLRSSNQLRMYEILKQYEMVGERIISLEELKNLLGIDKKDYERYGNFKIHVLDVCKNALDENTDICFTYEPTGKRGRGGKVFALKFTISKNEKYVDQLTLDEFLNHGKQEPLEFEEQDLNFYADACENEFNKLELQILNNIIIEIIPHSLHHDTRIERYGYLKRKYGELNYRASKNIIGDRFAYLKKMVESDL